MASRKDCAGQSDFKAAPLIACKGENGPLTQKKIYPVCASLLMIMLTRCTGLITVEGKKSGREGRREERGREAEGKEKWV